VPKKISTKFSFNAVVYAVAGLFLINMLAITGGSVFYFLAVDNLSREALEQRMSIAIDVEKKRLQEILVEYTYWDQGYVNSIQSEDKEWVEDNYGEYLLETYGYTFVLIIEDKDKIRFSSTANDSPDIKKSSIFEYGIDRLMSKSRNISSVTKDISSFICIKGKLYMVAVGPFVDENTEKPRPDNSYVVFAKIIDNKYLDSISRLYQLPTLKLSSNSSHEELSVLLLDDPDCLDFRLSCDPPAANWAILSILIPVITLLGASTFGLTLFLLNRYNQFRSIYENDLYDLATRDSLTGVYNRREFMDLGERLFNQRDEKDQHFSVLILDIDHFKSINDQHGHIIGDINLQVFAKILNRCVRTSDIIGRIGGEEFAAILVGVDPEEAYAIAERIRSQVEEVSKTGREGVVPMTVSIGVENVHRKGIRFKEALKNADRLMYRAKSTGKNKVVITEEG